MRVNLTGLDAWQTGATNVVSADDHLLRPLQHGSRWR